jgi:hypothetical protein
MLVIRGLAGQGMEVSLVTARYRVDEGMVCSKTETGNPQMF